MSREPEDLEKTAEAIAEVGRITASVIPMAFRVARKQARKVLGPEAPDGHVNLAANRIVCLALITNGFLIIERTEADPEECIQLNVDLAKGLLEVAFRKEGRKKQDKEDEAPTETTNWLDDAELRKMFEGGV